MNQRIQEPAVLESIQVTLVDAPKGFAALRPAWDALYLRDPDAHLFLSWEWLSDSFGRNPAKWSVLVAHSRSDGRLLGVLPLKYRVHWSRSRKEMQTEIEAGPRLVNSPYSGLLCDPMQEAAVCLAFGNALLHLPWVRFSLGYIPQNNRARSLSHVLETGGCKVDVVDGSATNAPKKRMSSRILTLPDTVLEHVTHQIPPDLGQRYHVWREHLCASGEAAIRIASPAQIEQALLAISEIADAGDARARSKFKAALPVIRAAQRVNRLVLPILQVQGRICGGIAHVHDPVLGTLFRITSVVGSSEEAMENDVALTLCSLHWAIENKCLAYDFGRLGSKHTFDFSTLSEPLVSLTARRDPADSDLRFDPICTGSAMRRIATFIKSGKSKEGLAACEQLADIMR